ncbi:MAG: hypothetical protein PUB07_02690 [Clostridia bacterium]|nr:hypothetical protein [Clostridia bacterium]
MEFFENLKNTISKTTQVAIKKSNDLVEITKLKMAVSEAESEVASIFRHIGETLYGAYKTGGESYESLEEQCELIDKKYEKIAELNTRIMEMKNAKSCPDCKKEMEKDAMFCSGCGHKF